MKMQVAFRDAGHVENGFRTVALTGLVEFPDGAEHPELPDGMIGAFVMDMVAGPGGLRPSYLADADRYRSPRDRWGQAPWPGTDVASMVTEAVWSAPAFRCSCEMFFRRTLVDPSSPGLSVMAASGMVAVREDESVDQDSIFQLAFDGDRFMYEGRLGEDLMPGWGAPRLKERMRGNAFRDFLRDPSWGFGAEPVSVPWGMSLEFAEEFDEYVRLALADGRSPAEDHAYSELRRKAASEGMDSIDRDPAFRTVMAGMQERGMLYPCARPMTRGECMAREEAMAELVRAALPPAI